jgi:WD40 repeat protein
LPNTGVTSLLELENGAIIAGTKKGQIFRSTFDSSTAWAELEGYDSKFPVYSLASSKGGNCRIFCGGGDRYISVWQEDDDDQFQLVDRLGPHTGWVKSLAYDEINHILFSIGCNCIEAWECGKSPIVHASKRSIENSPDMGSTLSSDLLCLCLLENGSLVSGGVDGRIHIWSPDLKATVPLFTITCHQGRVNRLIYSSETKLLFSVGNDGKLNAFRVSADSLSLKASLEISGCPRLTAASVLLGKKETSLLGLGTTCGQVIVVGVTEEEESVTMTQTNTIALEGNPMIYALCESRAEYSSVYSKTILVGHATDLVEVQLTHLEL